MGVELTGQEVVRVEPGSQMLPKESQERFAQLCVVMNYSAAYREVWPAAREWKGSVVWANASKMAERHAERIAWLRARAAERHQVTIDMVIQELKRLAFTDLPGIVDVTRDGGYHRLNVVDFDHMTPEQRASIQGIKVKHIPVKDGDDVVMIEEISVKQHSKLQALGLLGKLLTGRREKAGGVTLVFEGMAARDPVQDAEPIELKMDNA